MVEIKLEYLGDLRCRAKHGPSGTELVTDAPVDNQGKGESFSPTDLCATALASCISTIMGIQARTIGVDLAGMSVTVRKFMSTEPPRRISKLEVDLEIPTEVTKKERVQLERAGNHCPVHLSLHPEIEQVIRYNWTSLKD